MLTGMTPATTGCCRSCGAPGPGSEIMQRIAVPMIGGMISSTLLTLIVIPAIFGLVKGLELPPPGQIAAGGKDEIGEIESTGASRMK